jgi:hypothetical protein
MAAIDQKINLIGVPQVTQGLDQIVNKSKEATAAVNQVGSQAGAGVSAATSPIEIFNVSLKNSEQGIRSVTEATQQFSEGLHILRPILGELGASMGGLGEFSRLARVGLEGLAVAIAGSVIVKITTLSDELAKAKGKLGDLLGGQTAGASAFETISKDAEKLGTSVESLLPAFSSLIRAGQDLSSIHFFAAPGQDLPEMISGTKQAADAATSLFTVLRAGHATLDEAGKTTGDFAAALQNAGALTKQVASILLPFPKAFDSLKVALGASGQTTKQFLDNLDKAPISFQRVSSALQQLSAQIPATFDPKAPQGLTDAVNQLWNAVKEGAQIDQPKAFEKAIADLAPQVKEIAHDFTLWVPPTAAAFAQFFKDLGQGFDDSKRQIQNTSTLWDQFKKLLSTRLDFETGIGPFADQLKQIQQSMQQIKDTGTTGGAGLDVLKKAFADTGSAAAQAGQQVDTFKSRWDALTSDVQQSAKKLPGQIFAPAAGQTVAPPGSVFAPSAEAAPTAAGFVKAPAATIDAKELFDPSKVEDQVKTIAQDIDQAFAEFNFSGLSDSIEQSASEAGTTAAQRVEQAFSDLNFNDVTSSWDEAMNLLVQQAQTAWDRIRDIFSQQLPSPSGGFGFSGTPLAGGGLVTGGGTGTSDSIPAWLSNREFVLTAASTKFWGEGLLNWMNRAPRFAGGGAVTSQSAVVHLHLGNESFAMNASENVATALRQHAVKSRLVSTGRKPSWY